MTYRLRELNRRHLYLINIARDLKQSLQTGRVFIAAFALKSNRILTIGCNSYDDIHPESQFGKYYSTRTNNNSYYHAGLHAEIKTLKNLGPFREDYHKIELFVVRIGNGPDEETKFAMPCKNCQKVLRDYPFKKITFTTDNQFLIGELKFRKN